MASPVWTHAQLRRLFDRLTDAPAAEHDAILAEAGAHADDVRTLKAWLASDESSSPLDTPVQAWLNELDETDIGPSLIGQRAGPYLLTEILGRGGSSIVFRATRKLGDLEQVVALKLLQNGLYSQESRRRFRREQSILMQLSHPNIAPLIDAGLSDAGVPYLAMEEVKGRDLLSYANAKALAPPQRLRLLVDVCRAIDAAHRALIVHRDIKPSNVLVTDEGHVKVLDFGIAKLVDEDAAQTATQHIALTPDYAAPEQFAAGLVTTSADVYALGVLAGELLVGARLGADADLAAADAASPPVRNAWQALDRDLLNILRTATALEPAHRYASAGHLADDIERFLAGAPVAAHPPSRWYRVRKFVARHRLIASLSAAFFACVLLSLGVALAQAMRAQNAAVKARMEASRANTMRDFIFEAFAEAEPLRPHRTPVTISQVVDHAIRMLRANGAMDPRARLELRLRLAEVVGSQGDLERAGSLLREIRDEALRTLGRDDPLTMDAECAMERNLYFRGEYTLARAAVDRLYKRLADPETETGAILLRDSASIAVKVYDKDRAVRDAEHAIRISAAIGANALLRDALKTLGSALLTAGDLPRAVAVFERELALSREQFGADSDQVATALSGLSRGYRRLGNLEKAEQYARQALAIDRKIYEADHWIVASHLNALGMVLLQKRDLDGALRAFQESLRIDEKTLGEQHPDVAVAIHDVASVELAREDFRAALPQLARALPLSAAAFGEHHWRTIEIRADRAFAAAMLDPHSRTAGADLDRAIAGLRASAQCDPHVLGLALEQRFRLFVAQGDPSGARRILADLGATAAKAKEQSAYWAGRADCLGSELHLMEGKTDAAAAAAERCGAALRGVERPDPVLQVEQPLLLALANAESGNVQGAKLLADNGRKLLGSLPYPPRRLQAWAGRLPL